MNRSECFSAIHAWDSGGGFWVVTRYRPDGSLVVFSGDAVCEYESDEAFDEGHARNAIELGESVDRRWVISDREGNTFYEHDDLELGWADEYEARHQARALSSRTGEDYIVREQ